MLLRIGFICSQTFYLFINFFTYLLQGDKDWSQGLTHARQMTYIHSLFPNFCIHIIFGFVHVQHNKYYIWSWNMNAKSYFYESYIECLENTC
jgi:hypothetical protein